MMNSMGDKIEETPIETFQHVTAKLDIYVCIDDIAKYPERAKTRLKSIEEIIEDVVIQDSFLTLVKDANEQRKGETALHTAIKCFQFKSDEEKAVVELLISKFPKLILQDRGLSPEYAGQTPLHMAVSKGNIWLVNTLLKQLTKKETRYWKITLLKRKASGTIFTNTVMMGELPLTIAALTFNKGMFDLLLSEGADLDGANSLGDNVCHSLIRYGYLYPNKLNDVLEMCRKINEDPAPYESNARATTNRKLRKKIWLMENIKGLNPLKLAASLGLHEVFTFIMDQEAYCFENTKDGLFDIKIYDVTEIDAISSMKTTEITGVNERFKSGSTPENISRRQFTTNTEPFRKSILMMLFDLEPSDAFQFILFAPIMRVVNQKWNAYRKYFYPWWILHSVFMLFLTWYCIERSMQVPNTAIGYDLNSAPVFAKEIPKDAFVTAYGVICIVVSVLYILQELRRMVKGQMPLTFKLFSNPYSNGWFRVLFVLFALCLIIDFFVAIWSTYYENYLLILAMIAGWFLTIFFIRAVKPFSFFTVMIQNILIGDMLRFFVIIGIEILAFATAMHMAIQGSDVANDTEYQTFWRVLFSMFNLMVGVGDLAAIYNTRHPGLCIVILVGFIVLTTLLMINALIAMMSRTCMELVEDVGNVRTRERHWKLQKLSVILFLESILPNRFIFKVGTEQELVRYNNTIHRRKSMKRYMLEVRSLQNEDGDWEKDGGFSSSWGFRTAMFNALRNHQNSSRDRPHSGLSDKLRHFFKKKEKEKKKHDRSDKHDQRTGPPVQRPLQVQPPVSHVFGLNPMAADNGSPDKVFTHKNSRPAEIDIYHISHCRQCSISDVSRDYRQYEVYN